MTRPRTAGARSTAARRIVAVVATSATAFSLVVALPATDAGAAVSTALVSGQVLDSGRAVSGASVTLGVQELSGRFDDHEVPRHRLHGQWRVPRAVHQHVGAGVVLQRHRDHVVPVSYGGDVSLEQPGPHPGTLDRREALPSAVHSQALPDERDALI
jgi:hypothetical protein